MRVQAREGAQRALPQQHSQGQQGGAQKVPSSCGGPATTKAHGVPGVAPHARSDFSNREGHRSSVRIAAVVGSWGMIWCSFALSSVLIWVHLGTLFESVM